MLDASDGLVLSACDGEGFGVVLYVLLQCAITVYMYPEPRFHGRDRAGAGERTWERSR